MRIDKYLSYALNITRSNINKFIKDNDIKVNGIRVIKKDFKVDENIDEIYVNDKKLEYRKFVYYMLNKPSNLVCSRYDNVNDTIYSLFPCDKYELSSIGRLDKDTEGLLIITNDGALNHYLTSPNNHVNKKYYVTIDDELTNEEMKEFENGIKIKDGKDVDFITKKAIIEKIGDKKYYVTISEGKFHQIKRMFLYFNKNVTYLKRISFGNLVLDENLKLGEYRYLTTLEIEELKKL